MQTVSSIDPVGHYVCRDGRHLPNYRGVNPKLPAGIYLGLFHGRDERDQDMADWGYEGPMIGPLTYVHTTYASFIHLCFADASRVPLYFPAADGAANCAAEETLQIVGDLLAYDGRFFGDWTVFYHAGPALP